MSRGALITVVGPTASGKSSLGIGLAKKFDGEIVSADSRQVYRGMDIGTGKVTKREQRHVPHHLLDVASPRRDFNVAHFQKHALKAIAAIQQRGKIPFLVGGTGFWVQSVVDTVQLPDVKPNLALRKKLAAQDTATLWKRLQRLDPRRAATIDRQNPYRLIRAIEIVTATGRPVPRVTPRLRYRTLQIGIHLSKLALHRRIDQRLAARLRQGMVAEVARLHRQGVSWSRLEQFGLEYRYVARYLQRQLSRAEMVDQLRHAIYDYAKRQMTWFKRDNRIHWVNNASQAYRLVRRFLNYS